MVAVAVLGGDAPLYYGVVPHLPTGRLRSDLRELIDRTLRYLARPAIQAALPALMSEIATNDKVREHFERREEEWIATIRLVLERAVESGEAPPQALGTRPRPGRLRLQPPVLPRPGQGRSPGRRHREPPGRRAPLRVSALPAALLPDRPSLRQLARHERQDRCHG